MNRKTFITTLVGTSVFAYMDGFASVVNALSNQKTMQEDPELFATFGAVHLNVTSIEKSSQFWTNIIGMKLRLRSEARAEFGSEQKTLVVLHQTATRPYQHGYSGLYHIAIHVPNKAAFAKMLYRVLENNYDCSPIDHTMTQSIYMQDPDGITIEIALETPERFKRLITSGGLKMEDTDGTIRTASAELDVEAVLKNLIDKDISTLISDDYYIGHIHLYANNVEKSDAFYKKIGFLQFNFLPLYMYADLSAGGAYQHRIALNAWHGVNKPLAPADSAGLRHFQIVYKTKQKLLDAIKNIPDYKEQEGAFWVNDPTGNLVLLSTQEQENTTEKQPTSLEYLVRKPANDNNNPPLLVLLHGYGSNEHDLFSLAQQLPDKWMVLAVRGRLTLGTNQYAWYSVQQKDGKIIINPQEEAQSRKEILNLLDNIAVSYPFDKSKVVFAGFSQGANMAENIGLSQADKVAGFAVFSGRFIDEISASIAPAASLHKLKAFLSHGTSDAMLPIKYASENKRILLEKGLAVEYVEDAAGHTISPNQWAKFVQWLQQF